MAATEPVNDTELDPVTDTESTETLLVVDDLFDNNTNEVT